MSGSPKIAEKAVVDEVVGVNEGVQINKGMPLEAETKDEVGTGEASQDDGLGLDGVTRSRKSTIEVSPVPLAPLLPEAMEPGSHPADALHAPDSPTTSLISSLRDQLRLLSDQSQQLNTKLVDSISRHADLLDQHEALQSNHSELETRAEGLAKDKRQWEESMKTGLLVERDAITGEMQRLAAGLVEEERRRGSAEERRRKVEDEVDELAATLFDQANTMVASERHGRIEAEEKLKSTEDNLAAAEAAMRDMQLHLQSMPTSAASPPSSTSISAPKRKYLASHLPYTEYTAFLMHLRSLRPLKETSKAIFPPPLVSALLTQPHLARTITEDHEPTLRLDTAPDLSWLSRRGISSAIISGDLIIEPVSANTILSQTTSATHDIGCALCGKPVFPSTNVPPSPSISHFGPPPAHPTQRNSASRFSLKPFFNATSPSSAPSPTHSPAASPGPTGQLPSVYIFRVAKSATTTPAEKEKEKDAKSYPLCRTGWCLERLRATCELWHFVRTGIVHVVWHGDDGYVLPAELAAASHTALTAVSESPSDSTAVDNAKSESKLSVDAPPEIPRRKSGWGLGFRMGERSNSTGGTSSGGGGGWTKAFRAGTGGSPPVSPSLPPPGEEKEKELVTEDAVDGGEKLGAPLELEGGEAGIEMTTPEKSAAAEGSIATAVSAVTTGTPESADDGATFSTPLTEQGTLPETNVEAKEETTPVAKPVETGVVLNSPKVDRPSAPASPSRPPPPPIPRRAAARNRASIVIDGVSQQTTPSGSGTATPIEDGSVSAKPPAIAEGETRSSTETNPIDTGKSSMDLPPVPARNPRTPIMQVLSQAERVDGEKVYLKDDEDSWEARTWRQVVKLREQMLRTRLGIIEVEAGEA